MKTTASPAVRRRDQSLNSLLTRHFQLFARERKIPYRLVSSSYRSAGVAAEVSKLSSERPALLAHQGVILNLQLHGIDLGGASSVANACAYSSGVLTLSRARLSAAPADAAYDE